jgi:hypothetical protein
MSCLVCGSSTPMEFPAEMIIHLRGLKNLNHPGVWVFQNILICLECGFSSFTAPRALLDAGYPSVGDRRIDEVGSPNGMVG